MMPAEQHRQQVEIAQKQRANLAQMVETLKRQRAAIHQIGSADCKLIELDRDAAQQPRQRDLLEQKRDGTHRLAAARMEVLALQISQASSEIAFIDQGLEAASKMILTH